MSPKALAKLLFQKFYPIVEKWLAAQRYVFCRNRSVLIKMTTFLHNVIDAFLQCLYLDIEKAFEKFPLKKFIKNLYLHGFALKELKLMESYRTDRKQALKVGNDNSDTLPVPSGVSQKSVLVLLFFIVFINELPDTLM